MGRCTATRTAQAAAVLKSNFSANNKYPRTLAHINNKTGSKSMTAEMCHTHTHTHVRTHGRGAHTHRSKKIFNGTHDKTGDKKSGAGEMKLDDETPRATAGRASRLRKRKNPMDCRHLLPYEQNNIKSGSLKSERSYFLLLLLLGRPPAGRRRRELHSAQKQRTHTK